MVCQVLFTKTLVIAFDENGKAILVGWRETTGPWLWRRPLLPQQPTSPNLSVEPRQLTPYAHDTQLDAIHRLCNGIASVNVCPTTLPRQPMQHSACTALLERLGYTRATDATGTQYKIEFQYNTTVFTVMASSKGGRLPFDPHQIDLPSIPMLVAIYHACLGFPVKDTRLDAIKAGNCDKFTGLTYLNMACYCPNSDETILRYLAQTQQNVRSIKPQSTPRIRPQLMRPQRH